MRKIILLALVSFICLSGHTQFISRLERFIQQGNLQHADLLSFLDTSNKESLVTKIYEDEELESAFTDSTIVYGIHYRDSNSTRENGLYLCCFLNKKKIVALLVTDERPFRFYSKELYRYIDTSFALRVLKKWKRKDATPRTIDELLGKHPERYSIWENNPFADIITEYMQSVFDAVITGDSLKIIRDCYSFYPEQMAFGATGLYLWQKENHPLNKKAKSILNSLQKVKRRLAYPDAGCAIDMTPMYIVVCNDFLEHVYKQFLEYKKERDPRFIPQ